MSDEALDLWKLAQRMVALGKYPLIVIQPSQRVKPPKKKSGRPVTVPVPGRHYHYIMANSSGWPMTCRNFRCLNRIRKDQEEITCGPRCKEELTYFCKMCLDVMEGRMRGRDFPSDLRVKMQLNPSRLKKKEEVK